MTLNSPYLKGLVGLLSLAVALVSYRFLLLGLETAFDGMQFHIDARRTTFLLHVSLAPVALAIGGFQFSSRLRNRMPGVHRWMGRIYALAILISAVAALFLAVASFDRPIAALGFGLLAILWIAFTARAVYLAVNRRILEHRKWMIRSFALTFAAVTLRIQLPFFYGVLGMDYLEASSILGWSSWIPNLIFAEWLLRRENKNPATLN